MNRRFNQEAPKINAKAYQHSRSRHYQLDRKRAYMCGCMNDFYLSMPTNKSGMSRSSDWAYDKRFNSEFFQRKF